jgi:hypothetical protein
MLGMEIAWEIAGDSMATCQCPAAAAGAYHPKDALEQRSSLIKVILPRLVHSKHTRKNNGRVQHS